MVNSFSGSSIQGFLDLFNNGIVQDAEYNTNKNNLVSDFYKPILSISKSYDRSTGSFNAAGIKALGLPLVPFIRNAINNNSQRPIMRIVTSNDITENDYDDISNGYEKRRKSSEEELVGILEQLKNSSDEELHRAVRNIGTMVQLGLLDIKIAVPKNKLNGLFHRKMGVFSDFFGNFITFEGSQNVSRSGDGSETNLEGLVAFCSNEPTIMSYKENHKQFFEDLWNDSLDNVSVLPLEKYPRDLLKSFAVPVEVILNEINVEKRQPPRQCQKNAVNGWVRNGYKGIFDMCTASGKSRASLLAINILEQAPLTVIVKGNLIDLVDQWAEKEVIPEYGRESVHILKISSSYGTQSKLQQRLSHLVQDFLIGFYARSKKRVFVLATIQSASQEWFVSTINRVDSSKVAIIIDEVHHAGAKGPSSNVLQIQAKYRIGLSATYRRYDDDENSKLEEYFQGTYSPVAYKYSLSDGIKDKLLSPYQYFIHPISLEPNETAELRQRLAEYEKELKKTDPSLSLRIGDSAVERAPLDKWSKILELRNAWRNTLGRAIAKTDIVLQIVESNYTSLNKCIIYCANKQHLDRTSVLLSQRNWIVEPYDSHVPKEIREKIRKKFSLKHSGQPLFIGAIKCLDEGIDLPALDSAILVSSSRTEREWIQRRGRILRKHPDKEYSIIHDFILLPYLTVEEASTVTKQEVDYIAAELDRLSAFAADASNSDSVLAEIKRLKQLFSI